MMNEDDINGDSEEGHEVEAVDPDLRTSYEIKQVRSNHLETLIQRRSTVKNIVYNENLEGDIDFVEASKRRGSADSSKVSKSELTEHGLSAEDVETIVQVEHLKEAFSLQSDKAFSPKLKKVEVRLHDFSYYVPGDNSKGMIKTVYNQSFIYSLKKLYKRCRGMAVGEEPEPVPILKNISLALKPGNMYLVLGPPSCGMCTLISLSYIVLFFAKNNIFLSIFANR